MSEGGHTVRHRKPCDPVMGLLRLWSAAVYVFLFLPIVFVVAHSFTKSSAFLVWGGFSTKWYTRMFDNEPLKNSIKVSVIVAAGSTAIALVIGGLAGVALARRPGKWTYPFLGLIFLVLVTPEIVDALGYLIWFVKLGEQSGGSALNGGYTRLIIAHAIFSSAVVTLIVRARLAGLDESLEEAAADLYASPVTAFRQITLPLMSPALLAGGLLAFTFSLDNTVVSSFLAKAGRTPFPAYIFSSVRSVIKPDLGAAAALMLGFTLLSLFLVAMVLRRGGDSAEKVAATLTGT
ncbi:MAG: ABC transporter permease [Acidimicrobiia bacterium]